MDKYVPPFTATEEIEELLLDVLKKARLFVKNNQLSKNPVLRKSSRIKTIYSSCKIENNSLPLFDTTALLEGKVVAGPMQDIDEILNANEAYKHLEEYNPYSVESFLKAHFYMTKDTVTESGKFRSGNVGVYEGYELIHMGTEPSLVPYYSSELLSWAEKSKYHPLIKSAIVHYEIEFIHPFSDGNGRMGRLWQTLILSKWEPLFEWLPVETFIQQSQQQYYNAIAQADYEGNSKAFVAFMLTIIAKALEENTDSMVTSEQKVKSAIALNPEITAKEIATEVGLSERQVERIIAKLKLEGLLVREGANKNGYYILNKKGSKV